jgi:hypothetical protein
VLGLDPKIGGRVLVEEAGVVAVGAEVPGTADVDPQAITASMIARQDAISTLWNIRLIYCPTENFWMRWLKESDT